MCASVYSFKQLGYICLCKWVKLYSKKFNLNLITIWFNIYIISFSIDWNLIHPVSFTVHTLQKLNRKLCFEWNHKKQKKIKNNFFLSFEFQSNLVLYRTVTSFHKKLLFSVLSFRYLNSAGFNWQSIW